MNTFRILCVDSAVGNSNSLELVKDAMGNNVPPCAYIRPTYLSCRYEALAGGVWRAWAFLALCFRQEELAWLENKKIISIRLFIHIASASPALQYLSVTCPAEAAFVAGATSGACQFTVDSGADSLTASSGLLAAGWKELRIGSLSALTNVLRRGVRIESMGPGGPREASLVVFSHNDDVNAPYIEVQYEDENTAPAVEAIEPAASVVDSDQAVTFRWRYQQAVNAPQTHVSIQVRLVGQSWVDLLVKHPLAGQSYTAVDGILLRGECEWRVQVFCAGGTVQSAWSPVKGFLSTGSPAAPVITGVQARPLCVLFWQQDTQSGFEIELLGKGGALVHASGQQLSVERGYSFPLLLAAGPYTVRLRTLNAQMRWGPWASAPVYVQNSPVGHIFACATALPDGAVKLAWECDSSFDAFFVERDGQMILRAEGGVAGEVRDRAALGRCRYVVRGVKDGCVSDSEPCCTVLAVEHALLGGEDEGAFLPLEARRGGPAEHRRRQEAGAALVRYEGQAHPVAYVDGARVASHTLRFTVEKRAVYDGLLALVGRRVLYKDCAGDVVRGLLTACEGASGEGGFDVTLLIAGAGETEVRYE